MEYNNIRRLYYSGILILATYALTPGTIIRSILETKILGLLTPIVIISMSVILGAVLAYNRRFG